MPQGDRLTLSEYWRQQEDALRRLSVEPATQIDRADAFVLVNPSDPYWGFIDIRLWFDDEAFLDAFEFVTINERGTPHREKYSYHLSVDGKDVERHDFDPSLDDPLLRHHINRTVRGRQPVHIPSERISLVKMVEYSWGLIAEERGEVD